jgi:molybdate transport system substrate-binding protein
VAACGATLLLASALGAGACKSPGEGSSSMTERAPEPVVVAAAVSLRAPLEELARRYEAARPGTRIRFSFGASGDLAHQIREGAPAALFASAAEGPAKELEAAQLATRSCVLTTGALTLVRRDAPELAGLRWETLAQTPALTRLALGLTPAVPAGVYAEETLRTLGSFEALGPKIVRGANARNVLDMVARGEADAAIVYATDAMLSVDGGARVVIVGAPPASAAPRVVYPLDIVRSGAGDGGGDTSAGAPAFASALCAPDAAAVFARYGFGAP